MNKQLYIVPGYSAQSTNHWFPWLENMLQKDGFSTKTMNFPDPYQPNVHLRLDYLAKNMPIINQHTYFVTHSLGGVTLLRYLQEIKKPIEIGGYILVAGFYGLIPQIETIPTFADLSANAIQELADFSAFKPDYTYLSGITKNRIVIAAEDDYILPFKHNMSIELAHNLKAEFQLIKKGGHFLADDGFNNFPLLYKLLTKMLI